MWVWQDECAPKLVTVGTTKKPHTVRRSLKRYFVFCLYDWNIVDFYLETLTDFGETRSLCEEAANY